LLSYHPQGNIEDILELRSKVSVGMCGYMHLHLFVIVTVNIVPFWQFFQGQAPDACKGYLSFEK